MPSTAAAAVHPARTAFTDLADVELAQRAGRGDASAFEAIMRRHNRLLFRCARSVLRSDADAEDALQDAYLQAWRSIAAFRADAKLSTWLVRIVIRAAQQRLRSQQRRSARVIAIDDAVLDEEDEAMSIDAPIDPDAEPDRVAMRAELQRLIEQRIDALPEAFRTVFVLRAVQELDANEVAAALGLPEATVRTRFFRARARLREGLARDLGLAVEDAFAFDGARCDRIVAAVLSRIDAAQDPNDLQDLQEP